MPEQPEVNAELERARAMAAGHAEQDEPYLELRDRRKIKGGPGLQ